MGFDLRFRRLTLKTRLILSYLVILGAGGLVTSLVGSWIVSSTIMAQARRSVSHDLAAARMVFDDRLRALDLAVELTASGAGPTAGGPDAVPAGPRDRLDGARIDAGMDFLLLVGTSGRVLAAAPPGVAARFEGSLPAVVGSALAGRSASGAERLSRGVGEPAPPAGTEREGAGEAGPLGGGLALVAAAPVRGRDGHVVGALCGGEVLNGDPAIVDRVWTRLFGGKETAAPYSGAVTIFQGDVSIAGSTRTRTGDRALGGRVPAEVRRAVLEHGERWTGRTAGVGGGSLSAFEPIRAPGGAIIGMLSVGVSERAYTATRNRVILSFFGIATLGFILIIGLTYTMIRSITRPIGEMVSATRSIAAGRFDHEVRAASQGELALLADSFNGMLASLRGMKADLEDWGNTLEVKVRERTEELMAMQVRVAQSERLASLGMLAAGVAHEINNPLGGILALTALTLEDVPADDPNRENLEEVLRQTERCRDIVKGLLEFSRQSEGKMEPVDVNRILEGTLSLLSNQAMFFNVAVDRRLSPDTPPVHGDKSQLQQVFMNLLMNAVQAMDERGTITVTSRRGPDGRWAEIVVADTGTGIPPEKIDHIFDPFYSTKPGGQGTGLGLSIVYGIVTKHRGTISVDSEVGHGTAFRIQLPAAVDVHLSARL